MQRLDEAEWRIYYNRYYKQIKITDLNSEETVMSIRTDDDLTTVLPELNKRLTQEEYRIQPAKQEEKAKQLEESRTIEAQKQSLPDNVSIRNRNRDATNCGDSRNINEDKTAMQKELDKAWSMVTSKKKEEIQPEIPTETPEEHKQKLKEAKKSVKNSKMNSIKNLSSLAEMFKSHD